MKEDAQNEKKELTAVEKQRGVRPPCCYNCTYLGYSSGSTEQPYPELWCKKDVWHGVEDKETLLLETDCKLHEREA